MWEVLSKCDALRASIFENTSTQANAYWVRPGLCTNQYLADGFGLLITLAIVAGIVAIVWLSLRHYQIMNKG